MRDVGLYEELLGQMLTGLSILPDKPEESPESSLRALWHAAAGAPKSPELAAAGDLPELNPSSRAALRAMVEQRLGGIPLAHITGRQRFMGIEMLAGAAALIPRKETELLARTAIDIAARIVAERGTATVVDVCTGSGNVALAVAHHVPGVRVFAADISAVAIELAQRNATHLGLHERVQFFVGDLLAPLETPDLLGKVDLLTCNPPYISSAKVEKMPAEIAAHEPSLAFDGGVFGVAILMRLIQAAPRFVRAGGWLASEVGLGQAGTLAKIIRKDPAFIEVRTVSDDRGTERGILALL